MNVVPEIEMPGHALAAIAAYPELGVTGRPADVGTRWGVYANILNADSSTVSFMQDVLTEVMEVFPSRFIHVGGDEADKALWKTSPRLQERIKELGVKDEHELQSWFIQQMDTFLTAKKRRLVGWDEILEGGLAPGATVMSWRGTQGGIDAARAGHDVIMTMRPTAVGPGRLFALGSRAILAATVACARTTSNQVTADGTVELTQVDVAPFVSGRVVLVTVDEGATVRRGDTLVVLAQSALPADIEQRRARTPRRAPRTRRLPRAADPRFRIPAATPRPGARWQSTPPAR